MRIIKGKKFLEFMESCCRNNSNNSPVGFIRNGAKARLNLLLPLSPSHWSILRWVSRIQDPQSAQRISWEEGEEST